MDYGRYRQRRVLLTLHTKMHGAQMAIGCVHDTTCLWTILGAESVRVPFLGAPTSSMGRLWRCDLQQVHLGREMVTPPNSAYNNTQKRTFSATDAMTGTGILCIAQPMPCGSQRSGFGLLGCALYIEPSVSSDYLSYEG